MGDNIVSPAHPISMALYTLQCRQNLRKGRVRGAAAQRDRDIALGRLAAPAHLAEVDHPAPREAALAGPVPYVCPVLADPRLFRAGPAARAPANRDRQLQCYLPAIVPHSIPRVAGDDPAPLAAHVAGGYLGTCRPGRQFPAFWQRKG